MSERIPSPPLTAYVAGAMGRASRQSLEFAWMEAHGAFRHGVAAGAEYRAAAPVLRLVRDEEPPPEAS
jgi:hypothetical protein